MEHRDLLEDVGDPAGDQPIDEARLGERESEPLDARDLVTHFRLARDRLDHLAEDDPDADTGAHGTEAAADSDSEPRADPGGGREVEDCCKHLSSAPLWGMGECRR